MLALVDMDILAYRIGFASQATDKVTKEVTAVPEGLVKARLQEFIVDLMLDLDDVTDYEGYITEDSQSNFRVKLATFAPYKGNRKGGKPVHYDYLRKLMVDEWGAIRVTGEEADDAIARKATELRDNSIICSIDKDFLQVPGYHYNFVKREKSYVTDSRGFYNFCLQVIQGDRVDNIIGIRGYGPALAMRWLGEATDRKVLLASCAKLYRQSGDEELLHFRENCRLLWLRREPAGKGELIEQYLEETTNG